MFEFFLCGAIFTAGFIAGIIVEYILVCNILQKVK